MLEEDREAIRKMKADFDELADFAEKDFEGHVSFELRMSHYNTVYTAATRNASRSSGYPGYDVGELLYTDYQEMLTRYLMRFRDFSSQPEPEVFRSVLRIWEHYKILMKWNMRAFAYLARYYIVNHSKPGLLQVALSIFLEQIFKSHADVVSRATQSLLVSERASSTDPSSSALISTAIDLFSSMTVGDTQAIYADKFLRPYLARTRSDYDSLLSEWGESSKAAAFLTKIRRALAEEDERCMKYFTDEDRRIILSCVEGVLIDSPITREKALSAEDGIPAALANREEDLLKQYYDFFSRKEAGVKLLADLVRQQIEQEGAELSKKHEGDEMAVNVVAYVTSMMHLQDAFPHLLATCFNMNFVLAKAVREGLEHAFGGGVNVRDRVTGQTRQVPFCEWLAHYVDIVLQQGRGSIEQDIERIVGVLAYVTERDRFLISTRERMAERILFPLKYCDAINERCLIQRIRQRCGPASTAYLEGMLNDLDTSRQYDAMSVLSTNGVTPPFEVSLLVAKKGIWPLQLPTDSAIALPTPVQTALTCLKTAYLTGTIGRVLTWAHESSSAELHAYFKKGALYTLSVSAPQALVLLAYNSDTDTDGVRHTVEELSVLTGVGLDKLRHVLPPLLKARILLRDGNAGAAVLQASDTLTVNADFTSRLRKMRLPPSLVRVSIARTEEASRLVAEDRKPVVDACLVRIMKSYRIVEHTELIEQCQRQLKGSFVPDVRFIKQRVEDLLRREFIERDAVNGTKYKYLA